MHAEALQLVCEQKTLTIRRLLNAKIQAATSVQAEALQLVCEQKCCNKNARMPECNNARMQECNNARMQECKNARMQ